MTDFYKGDTFRSSVDDTWTTPKRFFESINDEFKFTLDAAALKGSTLVPNNWYGPDHDDPNRRDALTRDWAADSYGGPVWLKPPYGRGIGDWVAKADAESKKGIEVVCLVPARTDTNWWWNSCMHHDIRFIKGRLKFGDGKNSAPFPSALVVMNDSI